MSAAHAQSKSIVVDGRYWLTQPLAVGGMAEIFLAKHQTEDGFAKDVVIKRLRPELTKDPRVIEMFRDEAKVSGLLCHSNTVHAFDAGTHEGLPYIAMEYIRGKELNLLCRRGIACGEFLPLEHAVELVRQAALGMGYYHNLRDANGKRLELVHCDISPNNLLVGEDGYLQIIDFGIGQFRGQTYRDAQLVPGKLSYMSPEQARRESLDHRSDIFSLGIVLYEITLGRRLFRGPASEVLPKISACQIEAPTFANHDYPGALESIVMRALEARPEDRFQEAYDLADALGEYLREGQMRTGPVGIARYIDRLRVAEGGERRDEFVSEAEALAEEEVLDFDRGLFSGFQAMAAGAASAVESWDEVDEDESAVADALGIDIELVRAGGKAHRPSQEIPALIPPEISPKTSPEESGSDSSTKADSEAPQSPPRNEAEAAAKRAQPTPAQGGNGGVAIIMLLIGIAVGAAGVFLLGAGG